VADVMTKPECINDDIKSWFDVVKGKKQGLKADVSAEKTLKDHMNKGVKNDFTFPAYDF